ncbi:MAG: hypothetical protein R8P61_31890 [Bacteroidia bacterium]|nr:hypothetical protein [Bacteroidia bacterium]
MEQKAVIQFFSRVMIYLSPILILMLSLEITQRKLPNDYSHKKEMLESKLGSIESLILGTSHSYMGINPSMFEGKAFNLASTAQTLYFDRFLFEKYHQDMPKLKRLILPISYSSLGTEAYLNPGVFNKSYHFAYFYGSKAFINKLAPRRFSLVSLFTVKRSVDRTLAYYQGEDDLVESDEYGWYVGDDAPKDPEASGKTTGAIHDSYYDEKLIPENLNHIARIIEACKESDIEIYLVSLPMYKSYMETVKQERYELMVQKVDSLAHEYEISYFNHTFDDRFVIGDFFDSNHLNEKGAGIFTEELIRNIDRKETLSNLAGSRR